MNDNEPLRIEELPGFRGLLTDAAKKVYDTKHEYTVIQIDDQGVRRVVICAYFMVVVDPKDKEEAVGRMAKVFNLLVQQELIGGMLANPMALPLAKLEDQERLGLLMYVFPSLKTWRSVCDMPGDDLEEKQRKFFNRIVGVEAFITEGGLGTADWRKLPME
jgi:hypothetical protein